MKLKETVKQTRAMNNELEELSKEILERGCIAINTLVHIGTMFVDSCDLHEMVVEMEYEGFNKLVPSITEEEYACKGAADLIGILLEEDLYGFIASVDISYPENVQFYDDWSLKLYCQGLRGQTEYIHAYTMESLYKSIIETSDKIFEERINICRNAQQQLNKE